MRTKTKANIAQQLTYSFYLMGAQPRDNEIIVPNMPYQNITNGLQFRAPHAHYPTQPKLRKNAPGVRREKKLASRQLMIDRITAEREEVKQRKEKLLQLMQENA